MAKPELEVFVPTAEQQDASLGLSRVTRNFSSILVGNAVVRGLSFVTVMYLARVLGPQSYGQLGIAQATYTIGTNLADLGIQTIGMREVAQKPAKRRTLIPQFVFLKLCLAVVVALGLSVFALRSQDSKTGGWLIIAYGLCLIPWGLLTEWVFTGLQRMQFVAYSQVLQMVVYAAIVFALVRGSDNLLVVPSATFLGLAASATMLIFVLWRQFGSFSVRLDPRTWPLILRKASPVGISNLLYQVIITVPIILLGHFQGDLAAGYYIGAYRVAQIPYELSSLFLLTLYPVAAERWKQSPESMQPFLEFVLRVVLSFTVAIAMGTLVVGPQLLEMIIGAEFEASGLVFQIMIWNIVPNSILIVFTQLVLVMGGKENKVFRVFIAGALFSLSINLTLIPLLSYVGAAIASVSSQIALCLISYWFVRQSVRIRFWVYLFKPLVASIVMAIACWVTLRAGLNLWLVIALGALVYAPVLFAVGGVSKQDLMFVREQLPPRIRR